MNHFHHNFHTDATVQAWEASKYDLRFCYVSTAMAMGQACESAVKW